MAESIPKMRIPFRFSASLLMRMLWRPIWYSALVVLWEPARVEAQDAPVAQSPIFELHFDEDSLRVVHNEISRALSAEGEVDLASARTRAEGQAPSAPHFPFPAMANNWAKKIVWFNTDGTIKAQRSIPEGRKVLVPDNGAYVLFVNERVYEMGSQQVELQDAKGSLLWEARLPNWIRLSPTGETVVSVREGTVEEADFSIWGPQGKLADYETGVGRISFSADGQFLLIAERTTKDTTCVSLFDKQGQRLWQRHCDSNRTRFIERMSVFNNNQFIAFTYLDWDLGLRYLVVLDKESGVLWTRPSKVENISFTEIEGLIVVLQNKVNEPKTIVGNRINQDLEVVVLDVLTGEVQRSFPLPRLAGSATYQRTMLSPLRDGNLLFGFISNRTGAYHTKLQLWDPTGVLLREQTLNSDSSDWQDSKPSWSKRGQFIGVSMGRVFKVFNYTQIESSEE